MIIDSTSYDKHRAHAPGYGYEARLAAPTHIVVHSTSNPNAKNTPFTGEANFLLGDAAASAEYLIGKDGRIVQFLDPHIWAAWHAGVCIPEWANQHSIGIELHHSVGDPPYPQVQLDALAWLLRFLMAEFHITLDHIDTHGQIAIKGPYDRKHDPSDWPRAAFIEWRDQLIAPPPTVPPVATPTRYRVRPALPISQRQEGGLPYAGELHPGDEVAIDATYPNGYGHLADSRGFVPLAGLEAIQ